MKMKRMMILVLPLALVMLFAAAAPALACKPQQGTFTQTGIGHAISPGTVTVDTSNVQHVRGSHGEITFFGSPWGTAVASTTNNVDLSLTSFTGTGYSTAVFDYKTGVAWGVVFLTFNGLGLYTYNGPTITAYGLTVTHGQKIFGVLFSEVGGAFGTKGNMKGINEIIESGTGVSINVGTTTAPVLMDIISETYTYWST